MTAREEVRKTIIRLAKKRQRPGTGSARSFLESRTALAQWPDLAPVLGPIPWAVVGAAATRLYMPERVTADLDVAVSAQDGPHVRQLLQAAGCHYQAELSVGGSSWRTPDGVALDVLEVREPWFSAAVAEAQANRDPQGLPVLPLPYLVLMKFQASRAVDIGDITRMLGLATEEQLTAVRAVFAQYLPGEFEDLESLIHLGKLEFSGSS